MRRIIFTSNDFFSSSDDVFSERLICLTLAFLAGILTVDEFKDKACHLFGERWKGGEKHE